MRKFVALLLTGLLLTWTGIVQSGDEDAAHAIINKAIKARGGEEQLAKHDSVIMKEKGTYYGMGDGKPYISVLHLQRPNRFKMEIIGVFTMCLDGDKGWIKSDKGVIDMTKEQLELEQFNQKAGWIMHLLPLKDKAYKLTLAGSADFDSMKTSIIKVSRDGYPSVSLYFDKKSAHLVKAQFDTRSPEQGKKVKAEFTFSNFKTVDGVTMPHRLVLKHDDKLFVEAEVMEMKAAKLDAKTFVKPASE